MSWDRAKHETEKEWMARINRVAGWVVVFCLASSLCFVAVVGWAVVKLVIWWTG